VASIADKSLGIIIVDHGSRLDQSNRMLEELAAQFARRFPDRYAIVEPAHMELAEPSIATAFGRCVQRGARRVVVCPFFLGPGKHWTHDIPRLSAEAAAKHPGVQFQVAPTLGIDELMLDLLDKRIGQCLQENGAPEESAASSHSARTRK
jgi:sirohydrochlorin ferrochelatase